MGRRLVAGIVLALAVPCSGPAAKPPSPGHGRPAPSTSQDGHGTSTPKVMYVLVGTLSNFGTITITITHSNHQAKTLVDPRSPLSLTIIVTWSTKVVIRGNAATIADGDHGVVEVRLPRNTPAAKLARRLTTLPTVASQVIDRGPAR
jgi:hypothetical protein